MRRTLVLLAALILVAGAYWAIRPWLSGDERAVRRRLQDLEAAVSLSGNGPLPARLSRAVRIGAFFTPDAVIDLGTPLGEITGRDSVVALAAKAPVPAGGLTIRFVDVLVWIGPAHESASAYLTVTGAGKDSRGEEMVDAREIEMTLEKREGEWLVDRVKGISPIEPVR